MKYNLLGAARSSFAGLALLAAASTGCAVEPSAEPVDVGDVPATHQVVAEFVLHISPSKGQATLTRVTSVAPPGSLGSPGLTAESETSVNLCQEGATGNSDPEACGLAAGTQTVDLVTDQTSINTDSGCPSGFTTNSFCASVTLNSYWNRALPYTYVQVTAIKSDSGATLTGHDAINSDASLYGLSNTLGLWAYTSPSASVPSGSSEAFIGQSPYNTGVREWVFANPDNADTNVQLRVMSATTFSTYAFESLSEPYINACSGGTTIAAGTAKSTQSLPFPFTLYGTTYNGSTAALAQTVTFSDVGVITLGGTADTTATGSVRLPSCATTPCAGAPKPAIFPFWDDLAYGTGANDKVMCFATGGTAPNRYAAISWNSMRIAGTTASSLTFGAVLHEGTSNIDFVYKTMSSGARAAGNGATVGVQNETGTVATSTYHKGNYPSTTSTTLVPSP